MQKEHLESLSKSELIELVTDLQSQISSQQESSAIESHNTDKQDRFLRETLDILPAIFYAKDLDGSFFMANKAFRNLFNLTEEQIINKNNHDLFSKEIADAFRKNDLEIIHNKKTIETEEIAIGDDGKERHYHSFKFPYFDKAGEVWATGGISLDITEKKQFERQAFHNSKLASIGELAAGVGHEINNPLSIIMGHLTLLEKRIQKQKLDNSSALKQIKTCLNSAQRITNIVNGLRTFARADDTSLDQTFNVQEMLEESISMLEEIYSIEEIAMSYETDSMTRATLLKGNRGKVQQLFINLISNAKDATAGYENRKISIQTKVTKNKSLQVSVSDNGCGIPPDIEPRIFDPFFTTKEVNQGTGIGLGLVANIAKDHGGTIKVDSAIDKGSTFTVEFPIEQSH